MAIVAFLISLVILLIALLVWQSNWNAHKDGDRERLITELYGKIHDAKSETLQATRSFVELILFLEDCDDPIGHLSRLKEIYVHLNRDAVKQSDGATYEVGPVDTDAENKIQVIMQDAGLLPRGEE